MHKRIVVSFPVEMVNEQKEQITEQLNKTLEPIVEEISSWNGFVDFTEIEPGNFGLIAKCDNDDIRKKMQEMINANIEEFYK